MKYIEVLRYSEEDKPYGKVFSYEWIKYRRFFTNKNKKHI